MVSTVRADEQVAAPGTGGSQGAVVVDTGANGLCETTATGDDVQVAEVGFGTPFQNEIRCGPDRIANTTATGDDTQLVAVGATCKSGSTIIIDSGEDGLASTTASGDDVQIIAPGSVPAHSACIITGPNGIADTPDPVGGDDVRKLAVGTVQPNSPVILCGPNGKVDTTANNVNPLGDDVQVVPVGSSCSPDDVVVDSGADGFADTRAEGSELIIKTVRSSKITIGAGHRNATKTINVTVTNEEFGAVPSRTYKLSVSNGNCPKGTVSQIDADSASPGLQATATIAQGQRVRGSFVVTLRLQDITTSSSAVPFRCQVNVEADVVDPDLAGAPDDAANPENNATPVDLEITDRNDL
jgi:hypothetical protein